MNKEEFMKLCKDGGYADKKVVVEYCKGKADFDDSDLIEVFHISQREKDLVDIANDKWRCRRGMKKAKKQDYTDI